MVERKLFKTKLCVLYQRGHCPRQNCSFAHGKAELRQFMASQNGKREYRGGDLRDKLDKRLSPQQRYSPGRDARGRRTFRGSSTSRSLERNRKRRKIQDGRSDFSESLKSFDGVELEGQVQGRKNISSELKEVQSNINMLDHQTSELKILVEEKVEEAYSLTSRIQELEAQLSKEKEECRRITSKTKKFVKAYKHYVRAQDELKRSQVRFQKLGDQLVSATTTSGGNEEDSNINIVSDGETTGYHAISPRNMTKSNSSPSKKNLSVKWDAADGSAQVNLTNGGGYQPDTVRLGKLSQLNTHATQSNIDKEMEVVENRNGGHWHMGNESKQKRGKNASASYLSADKVKGSGSGLLVPSTSMAAHAIDELVEIELEENIEVVENVSLGIDKGAATYEPRRLPFVLPPPPPVPQNAYSQYVGEDVNVDVEELEEEMVNVDIV